MIIFPNETVDVLQLFLALDTRLLSLHLEDELLRQLQILDEVSFVGFLVLFEEHLREVVQEVEGENDHEIVNNGSYECMDTTNILNNVFNVIIFFPEYSLCEIYGHRDVKIGCFIVPIELRSFLVLVLVTGPVIYHCFNHLITIFDWKSKECFCDQ